MLLIVGGRLGCVTLAAGLLRHAQIGRVDEADELPALAVHQRDAALRIRARQFAVALPLVGETRADVRLFLDALVAGLPP